MKSRIAKSNGTTHSATPDALFGQDRNNQSFNARRMSDIATDNVNWYVDATIPARTLTLVVGMPEVGKSSFGAWLCSRGKIPAVIPGSEESVSSMLIPRMLAAGVNLSRGVILDDRPWVLPVDKVRLAQTVHHYGIDFLWIDPIDSLLGEESENDASAVRPMLESLHWIAESFSCTIVGARHPGKAAGNVCPGSRAWKAVPRAVVQLSEDRGPPSRRFLTLIKSSCGVKPLPRKFSLEPSGEMARFVLGDATTEAEASLVDVEDKVDRWKIDEAQRFLTGFLADGEQLSTIVFEQGDKERLNERILRRAGERLGVEVRRDGVGREHRSYWYLPTEKPEDSASNPTPDNNTDTGGGVPINHVRSGKTRKKTSRKKTDGKGDK